MNLARVMEIERKKLECVSEYFAVTERKEMKDHVRNESLKAEMKV